MIKEDVYVTETPGIGGGYPHIRGTRTPVGVIVEVYQSTRDFERTTAMFPHLTHEQVRGALDFYAAHPERVAEDIERNQRALAEFLSRNR